MTLVCEGCGTPVGPKGAAGVGYKATQDLCTASTRSTVTVVQNGSTSWAAGGDGDDGDIWRSQHDFAQPVDINIGAIVAADDNAVVINISYGVTGTSWSKRAGTTAVATGKVKLWTTKGDPALPFDQATCGPDNMPRGGYILPTTATVAADGKSVIVTRSSAVSGVNSAVVAPCAPYVNDGVQNVTLNTSSRSLTLADGRCIVRVADAGAEKTTVGACNAADPATQWLFHSGAGRITSAVDGSCLAVGGSGSGSGRLPTTAGGPYLRAGPCGTHEASNQWSFLPSTSSSIAPARGAGSGMGAAALQPDQHRVAQQLQNGTLLFSPGGGSNLGGAGTHGCFTAVEPSFVHDAAMVMRLVDPATGEAPSNTVASVDGSERAAEFQFDAVAGQTVVAVVSALTTFDVYGLSFPNNPLASRKVDAGVIAAAVSVADATALRIKGGELWQTHAALWQTFWNSSSIDIASGTTPVSDSASAPADNGTSTANESGDRSNSTAVGSDARAAQRGGAGRANESHATPATNSTLDADTALKLLEANYYGSQYILASAGRVIGSAGHSRAYPTPPGGAATLFGPFSTGDYIGWNGDVTLNYNAETPLYGAPSSNHLELSKPFFEVAMRSIPLARRRASRQPWPGISSGASRGGRPGLPGQQVDEYTNAGPGGVKGVNFPGHIGPFGLHDWTDRGQRSNGAFAATPFIDYYEYTRDVHFLNTTAYPFVREVARFYADFAVKENVASGEGSAWKAWDRHLGVIVRHTTPPAF